MKSILRIALWTLAGFFAVCAQAQTMQLTQTVAGPNCHTYGCINTPLSDGELLTWCHVTTGSGCTKLSFRGLNYFMTAKQSGWPTIAVDLTSTDYENNGFAVHTDFDSDCFRCVLAWDDGYLQLNNEYLGSDPYLYGYNGQINITNGTGQVGVVTANMIQDQIVMLSSGDSTLIQVPNQVTIPAGSLDTDFTITATAPSGTGQTLSVIVAATFPDGTMATMKVTVEPVPIPPSSDSELIYLCGSKRKACFQKGR